MHFGTVFQAKRRPKTVPKPPSTPASIQECLRQPPDFDFQAMLGQSWPHFGPMLIPCSQEQPKRGPGMVLGRTRSGPGAAQGPQEAPGGPQEASRGRFWTENQANLGPCWLCFWLYSGLYFGQTKVRTTGDKRRQHKRTHGKRRRHRRSPDKRTHDKRKRDKRSTNERSRDNRKQEKGSRHKRRQDHESQDKGKARHQETLEMMPPMCHANRHGSTN